MTFEAGTSSFVLLRLPLQRFSPVCSRPKITIWVTPSSFSAAIISRFAAWLQKRRRTVAGARSQHSSDITAAGRRDYPLFFPSILPLFHPSVWKRKDAAPLLPGGCLVWGLVSVCCDSWGSHESGVDSLAPPHPCSASSPPSHPYATVARGLACLSGVRSHLALQWPLTSSTARQLAAWVAKLQWVLSGLLLQAGTRRHHSGNVACNYHLINALLCSSAALKQQVFSLLASSVFTHLLSAVERYLNLYLTM